MICDAVSCEFCLGLHVVCLHCARVACITARVEIANGFTLRLRYDRHNTDGSLSVTPPTPPRNTWHASARVSRENMKSV